MIGGLDGGLEKGAEMENDCNSAIRGARAEEGYFTGRMLESVARAGASADSLARLVHYDLAGRYSVAALAARRKRSLDRCALQSGA